ncbi:phytoene desaturase family protein [Pseudonocardia xishanensis]|uniref:Phytoene desaturase family protein n=1 Tax=Pseudonocardia xishanensis TaxID=630995 RepID=A0ABP8RT58_9PSEU
MRVIQGPTDHVVVVGAGLAGLCAALHLLGAGRRVTIVERGSHPGGRAGRLDLPGGYRVDTGPTVLTMPGLLDEALHAVGDSLADRLDLVRLDPAYRTTFADGSTIDVHDDPDEMEAEVRKVCGPEAAVGYRDLRGWLSELYRTEIDTFIGANLDSPFSLVGPDLLRLARLGGFGRLGPRIARFLPDERLQRIFSFQSLYAGVAPAKALGAYGVIAYMDTVAGVWFPKGGMRRVGDALAAAAVDAGAELVTERRVTGLTWQGDRVTAVRHTGDGQETESLPCDAVVLTADLPEAYRLLGGAPRRPVPIRWAPSAVVAHLAVQGPLDLAHHTISFGAAWERTFAEIIDEGTLMSDPSLLLTRPTATDPTLAPAGHDLLFLLAPCPNLEVGPLDWDRVGPAYLEELLQVLRKRGVEVEVEQSSLVTPADWAAQGMAAGTPFSAAHTFAQTGPFRPRNLPRRRGNVVLAGCGTTPGVGIPPVVLSGRLAAQRVTGVGTRPGTSR